MTVRCVTVSIVVQAIWEGELGKGVGPGWTVVFNLLHYISVLRNVHDPQHTALSFELFNGSISGYLCACRTRKVEVRG